MPHVRLHQSRFSLRTVPPARAGPSILVNSGLEITPCDGSQRGLHNGMSTAPPGKLWIGPSGWSYDDWYGIVYPQARPRGFKPLKYLARYVPAVEVNSSFYRAPSPRMTATWPPLVP